MFKVNRYRNWQIVIKCRKIITEQNSQFLHMPTLMFVSIASCLKIVYTYTILYSSFTGTIAIKLDMKKKMGREYCV